MISEQVLKTVHDAHHERRKKIANAWECYQGKYPDSLKKTVSDPMAADNIKVNFAAPLVDKGVSFLVGQALDFEIDGADESSQDLYLDAVWEENKQDSLLHLMAMNGGATGDVFVRLMLPDTAKGKKYARILNLDPACVTPIWNMDDYEDILGWVVQWNAVDPYTGKPVVRRSIYEPEGGRWVITEQISRGDSTNWLPWGDPSYWPYPWSPILHCQNLPMPNEYYGISDIEQHVLSINYAVNFVLSNMARIIRTHAHPKTWGTGFTGKQVDMSVDSMLLLPKDSKLENLEMQTDLGSTLELYKRLKELLHEVARVPEVATGRVDNIGPLSGVALKILYQSLIEKNQTKQVFYGDLFRELNLRLLEIGKQGAAKIIIHYPDPLPKDVKDEAEAALILEQVGVSKNTVLTELGYDPEAEAKKVEEETKAANALGAQMLDQFDKGTIPGQDDNADG